VAAIIGRTVRAVIGRSCEVPGEYRPCQLGVRLEGLAAQAESDRLAQRDSKEQ
jgi:hypothetical protein